MVDDKTSDFKNSFISNDRCGVLPISDLGYQMDQESRIRDAPRAVLHDSEHHAAARFFHILNEDPYAGEGRVILLRWYSGIPFA
jgi:hypothetical protein